MIEICGKLCRENREQANLFLTLQGSIAEKWPPDAAGGLIPGLGPQLAATFRSILHGSSGVMLRRALWAVASRDGLLSAGAVKASRARAGRDLGTQ